MQRPHVPGLELSAGFYADLVRPLLEEHYPELKYSAALIGSGSEVLGYDDAMSSDHHWGPRVLLFLQEEDLKAFAESLRHLFTHRLPHTYRDYPTHYTPPNPDDGGVQHMLPDGEGPVNHRVETATIRGFFQETLGFDIDTGLTPIDWLTFPEQRLLSLTSGAVFHDDLDLEGVRRRFAYYPYDVWIYQMAAVWARIGQEEHLMGRAGLVGDELGSALIASRLVRDIMRLGFLQERTYAPYPKWFGTAFSRLSRGPITASSLRDVIQATNWQRRQAALVPAYEFIARTHNALGITVPLPEEVVDFWSRPFKAIACLGFAQALLAAIEDPEMKRIARRPLIGGVDILSDNTDLLENISLRPALESLYR